VFALPTNVFHADSRRYCWLRIGLRGSHHSVCTGFVSTRRRIALAQKLNRLSLRLGSAAARYRHHDLLPGQQGALEPHGRAALAGEGRDHAIAVILHCVIGDAVYVAELQALSLYRAKLLRACFPTVTLRLSGPRRSSTGTDNISPLRRVAAINSNSFATAPRAKRSRAKSQFLAQLTSLHGAAPKPTRARDVWVVDL
jgi:hypothetical protein